MFAMFNWSFQTIMVSTWNDGQETKVVWNIENNFLLNHLISPHHRHLGQTDHFLQGKLQIFDLYWNQEEGLKIFLLINISELKFILLCVFVQWKSGVLCFKRLHEKLLWWTGISLENFDHQLYLLFQSYIL